MRTEHPPVRDTDPYTSWLAASQVGSTYPIRALIYSALLHFGPMTHDQLIEAVNKVRPTSPSSVRTRCSEMVEDGMVERHPTMQSKSRYGRASLLWRIVE